MYSSESIRLCWAEAGQARASIYTKLKGIFSYVLDFLPFLYNMNAAQGTNKKPHPLECQQAEHRPSVETPFKHTGRQAWVKLASTRPTARPTGIINVHRWSMFLKWLCTDTIVVILHTYLTVIKVQYILNRWSIGKQPNKNNMSFN